MQKGATKPVVVVMGVAGSGKSTIGVVLATRLGVPFQEGDLLHPEENVRKMAAGIPLGDADRWPWLERCKAWIEERVTLGEGGVLACSALKRSYRDFLSGGVGSALRIVFLEADAEVLVERMEHRPGHYMPPSLLQSQLNTLEVPDASEHPIIVNSGMPIDDVAAFVVAKLGAVAR